MKRLSTIVLASVGFAATGSQLILSLALTQHEARKQLVSIFTGIYGGMPRWTELMLSWGKLVWLFPAVSAVLLFLALWRKSKVSLPGATTAAVVMLAAMFYAVYPIHLMLKGGVI
jgi:hypothetical protein